MSKCEVCGGKMKKSTSPFGYVTWYCSECGNEDMANKLFKKPK